MKKTEKLLVTHWNCNAIFKKQYQFFSFLNLFKPDIVCLNETKISEFRANNEIIIKNHPNYYFFHKHRHHDINGAGGVAMMVRKSGSFKFEVSDFLDYLELETICLKININNKDVFIVSYYNPPDKPISEELFEKFSNNSILVLGDLNAKNCNISSDSYNFNTDLLNNIVNNQDLIFLNDQSPTHTNFSSLEESILDYAIASPDIYELFDNFKVYDEFKMGSDHHPIFVSLKLSSSPSKPDRIVIRTDWDLFSKLLPISFPSENLSIEEKNCFIKESIISAYSNSTKTFSKNDEKNKLPKYISELIVKKKNLKNKLHKNPSDNSLRGDLYLVKRTLTKEIDSFLNSEWDNFLNGIRKTQVSSKPFWDKINQLRGSKNNSSRIPDLMVGSEKLSEDEQKANHFAKRLQETFSEENNPAFDPIFKSKIDQTVASASVNFNANIEFNLLGIEDVDRELGKLRARSASGLDGISNSQLTHISEGFKLLILDLVNHTLKSGQIPGEWKDSIITMIPKKGISKNPKDYRPISLTSCLAKLCERMILHRLYSFVEQNKLLVNHQSGFRQKRQTKDNLAFLIQKISESFNRKKKVCGFFFDIASAFDKVWHNGLIFKMLKMNIPLELVRWISDFLSNRSFMVKVNGSCSAQLPISTGVPQGSVLSPTLFSIFINDIPNCENKNSSDSLLFADDLACFFIFKKTNSVLLNRIKKYLEGLEKWLREWRLIMSPSKCNQIIFTKRTKNFKFKFKLFGEFINQTDDVTFLGLRFDSKLSFINQINYIKQTTSKRLNILKILSNRTWNINKKTLINIYKSLVLSVIDYSSIIFDCLTIERKRQLQIIQNNCLRIILKKPFLYTRIDDLHKEAGIEKIEARFSKLNSTYFSYAILNKNPLISKMCKEYISFVGARKEKITSATPLCTHIDKIKTILDLNSHQPP